tara:strand:+ start:653 stop:1477 length:825 start_codon:yes stop_codon:yes gene_type:complete
MDWIVSQKDIEAEILNIEQSFVDSIVMCNQVISYCQKVLEIYRQEVMEKGFLDETSEIKFFKHHKQTPLSYIIQYSKQLAFELDFQKLAMGMDHQFITKRIEDMNQFLSMHQDFVMYMGLEQDYMDVFYFTRKHKMMHCYGQLHGLRFDPSFSTSHDLLLATITANKGFQEFLHRKLGHLTYRNQGSDAAPSTLHWTASKTALVELVRSLKLSAAINHGNMNFKAMITIFEIFFGIDLGDTNHAASRSKNRSNPTLFLDRLRRVLLDHFRFLDK